MNSYMYKREVERKSLEVSCVLDVGRQKISSNYKIILVIIILIIFFVFFTAESISICETQPR